MFGNNKEEDKTELVFTAKLVSDNVDDKDREFIIRMAIASDEVKIWENDTAGFRGGFFYKSPHYRDRKIFDPSLAYLGANFTTNLHTFKLVDAPDSTLNYMESQPLIYPYSDLSLIFEKVRPGVNKDELRKKFEAKDKEKIGRIPMNDAEEIIAKEFSLNEQEMRTIMRRYKFYNTKRFDYQEFLVSI